MRHAPTVCVLAFLLLQTPRALYAQSASLVTVRAEEPSAARAADGVVATIERPSGARVLFLALGKGRAAVAEVVPAGEPSVTDALVRSRATPLEMFMALAPEAHPPETLRTDHTATVPYAPRRLTLPPLSGVPIDNFDCNPGENFEDDWQATYSGVTAVVASATYAPFEAGSLYVYPGEAAATGSGANSVTHLGVCGADLDHSIEARVERGGEDASWSHRVTAVLGANARFTFHAYLPGRYRMRVRASEQLSEVALGAAYTPEPGWSH